MEKRLETGFIVRVSSDKTRLVILVYNLRTGQQQTFASWHAATDYMQSLPRTSALR